MADLTGMMQAAAGSAGGGAKTFGRLYAESYTAATSGSIIEVATTDDLETEINSSSDGDALLLEPGTYDTDCQIVVTNSISDVFRGKNILIVGDTDTAQDVLVNVDNDGDGTSRDHPIFAPSIGSAPTIYRQLAFLSYKRIQISTTNYISSLVSAYVSADSPMGVMVNCYFDNNNSAGSANVSWHYNNSNSSTIDVRFVRCTFASYDTWSASYSGLDNVVDVGSCLFSGATDTTEYVNLGGNVTSATIDTANRTYNTSTYPTAGHLYVPNTNVIT